MPSGPIDGIFWKSTLAASDEFVDPLSGKIYSFGTYGYSSTVSVLDAQLIQVIDYVLNLSYNTQNPTFYPSLQPTLEPTISPTINPTTYPSSFVPTLEPTIDPTLDPTTNPSLWPITPSHSPFSDSTIRSSTKFIETYVASNVIIYMKDNTDMTFWAMFGVSLGLLCILIAILGVIVVRIVMKQKAESNEHVDSLRNVIALDIKDGNHKEGEMNDIEDMKDEADRKYADDGIPGTQPVDNPHIDEQSVIALENWFASMELSQYSDLFVKNGYDSIDFIKEIIDMSQIVELGIDDQQHQTKIMHGIQELQGVGTNRGEGK